MPSLVLRPYQDDILARARVALKEFRRILITSPTGSGKTALIVYLMSECAARGLTSIFCVHQNELLQQTSRALWEQRLEHGLIASGKRKSLFAAQVASVQTLVRRLKNYDEPKIIIIDEAHRSAAQTYLKILKHWPNALVIGLTATGERTDGKGLNAIFKTIVPGPQIAELIDLGYLCDYRLLAPPPKVDLSGVQVVRGDYDAKQAEAAVDSSVITGDAVQHYLEHGRGRRCAVMCISVKHAGHVLEQYLAAGIKAELLFGEMENSEREAVIERVRKGETRVVVAVNLLIEGVDIPGLKVIQWLRPTKSLIIWMQGNGRGFRPFEDEELLILDHVGNWKNPGFGLPDAPRFWSLDGRKARVKNQEDGESFDIRQCPSCFAIFRSKDGICPNCSLQASGGGGRDIEVVEGRLAEIEREQARKRDNVERAQAKSLRDLVALGNRKGIKNCAQWACHIHAGRRGEKPSKKDFDEADKIYAELIDGSPQLWPV